MVRTVVLAAVVVAAGWAAASQPTSCEVRFRPRDVLHDNGPFVNSPGTGVGGADESLTQDVTLGMETLGFGHMVIVGSMVADDFTVPAEGWTVHAVTFFAYQTGAPQR